MKIDDLFNFYWWPGTKYNDNTNRFQENQNRTQFVPYFRIKLVETHCLNFGKLKWLHASSVYTSNRK